MLYHWATATVQSIHFEENRPGRLGTQWAVIQHCVWRFMGTYETQKQVMLIADFSVFLFFNSKGYMAKTAGKKLCVGRVQEDAVQDSLSSCPEGPGVSPMTAGMCAVSAREAWRGLRVRRAGHTGRTCCKSVLTLSRKRFGVWFAKQSYSSRKWCFPRDRRGPLYRPWAVN